MKRMMILALALCLTLSLCACGGNGGSETTAPEETTAPAQTTAPQETTEPAQQGGYTVTVVDEGGNPISGALIQLCKDSCTPTTTNERGVASWPNAEPADGYKVSFLKLPEGYAYADETTEFYFGTGETKMTITLKAVA